ncbi:MAG: M20/M25/M40 family metallo-hydrolase [Deltaproteobacteria bacterium]|nr:M20/M25/M40 family metallo-hydrolase [Deltaproteobacteria bacterium]
MTTEPAHTRRGDGAYPTPAPRPAQVAQAVEQLVRLMAADSTSGREAPAVDVAEAIARELGLAVERLPTAGADAAARRDNLLIGGAAPEVVLCTHLDTVPPFIPPRLEARGQPGSAGPSGIEAEVIHGRGACDAKGVAIAMLHALVTLRASGVSLDRIACLLVVGEETDHAGARSVAASGRLAPRHVVLGEPCGLRPALAQKGLLKLRVTASGRAAHSAYPELGASAVHRLIDALHRLTHGALPSDPALGPTTVNVGRVAGGVAPNVIAPSAEATLVVRCAAPVDAVLAAARALLGPEVEVDEVSRAEPIDFDTLGGALDGAGPAVPFNTDAAWLAPLGARLSLMGPGDMRVAHGDHERLAVKDLAEGIERFTRAALALL